MWPDEPTLERLEGSSVIGDVDLVEVETCRGVDLLDVLVDEEYELALDMYGCFRLLCRMLSV